jgi:hypothetical protein
VSAESVNRAFTAFPCINCDDFRRDEVLARLASFYLAYEAGQTPAVPTRAEVLRGCCRQPRESFTLLGAPLMRTT